MPDIEVVDIADKQTLTAVKADTTALKGRGGMKFDVGGLYGYNPTTNTWQLIDLSRLSGANPTLIIVNDSGDLANTDITVTHEDGWFEVTQNMGDKDYDTFVLPILGDYTVSYESTTQTVTVDEIGGVALTL